MRGRKPKPAHLKVVEGNPGKRDIKDEPKPKPVAPECPEWLPAEAKKRWQDIAPELERLGLLTVVDGPAYASMWLSWALAVAAAGVIREEGIMARTINGGAMKHPAATVLREQLASFRQWCSEFGLTPAARARLSPDTKGEEDEMDKLIGSG